MDVAIHVARAENEAASELERILAQADLFVAGCLRTLAGLGVIRSKQVQDIRVAETRCSISLAVFVDEQREFDSSLLSKETRIVAVTKSNRNQICLSMLAQLRDVLAAEDSTVVAEENDSGGLPLPESSEAVWLAVAVREDDGGQSFTERVRHD